MPKNKSDDKKDYKVLITKNGPYFISGNLPLAKEIITFDENGDPLKWIKGESYPRQDVYSLCRCGHSKDKPYCDGTHLKISFDGIEVASRKKYIEQAKKISGPNLILNDAIDLCASARFCDRAGGTWQLTLSSNDTKLRKTAIQEVGDCPSGRLVACDKKTGNLIEPKFKPSISLIEDPGEKVSGPIWVKGEVPIESSDGTLYEIRNRVTLCRCGKSANKPFCDGSHILGRFSDGDKNIK